MTASTIGDRTDDATTASGKPDDDLFNRYSNNILEIRGNSSKHLEHIRSAASEPNSLKNSEIQAPSSSDFSLPSLLEDAATSLETKSAATCNEFQAIMTITDPLHMQKELQRVLHQAATDHAAAAEIQQRSVHYLEKEGLKFVDALSSLSQIFQDAIELVEHECEVAGCSMTAQRAAAESAYLMRLANRKEAYKNEFNTELARFLCTCDFLRAKRMEMRANQEKELEVVQAREHAAHDVLWLEMSQQATELACKICAARIEQMTLKDKLIYNCRVLGKLGLYDLPVACKAPRELIFLS